MRRLFLAVLLLAAPLSLFAQSYGDDRARSWSDSDPTVEIAPFVGLRWGGTLLGEDTGLFEDVDIDNSEAYGINVAFPLGRSPLKQRLLHELYGDDGIEQMRAVKQALDPRWKLSPGVLFPQA